MSLDFLLSLHEKIEIFNKSELDMFMDYFKNMEGKPDKNI
jgi:hypothetical protein